MKTLKITSILVILIMICEYNMSAQNLTEKQNIEKVFKSNLKPNVSIYLNQKYLDTIQFLSYNDDYDYAQIIGKKDGIECSLFYKWERYNTEKYNFKYGDILKLEWKMDSIWIAGEEETLDFHEWAIDAEKIRK